MPQFEVESASGESQVLRARDAADACRRAGVDDPEVSPEADVQGWREVMASGEPAGRVRDHSRMRFRRD